MKTLAAIRNELFKDYLKIVSTENLDETLDNPLVPVPFTCVTSVQNENSDALMNEINGYFIHRKIKNKDFLALDEDDMAQLNFMFNLIQISSGGKSVVATKVQSPVKTNTVEKEKPTIVIKEEVEIKVAVAEQVSEQVTEQGNQKLENEAPSTSFADDIEEMVGETQPLLAVEENGGDIIETLGIPTLSVINLIKDEKITAKIIDEKTIEFENETLSFVDGTKKAFKKAGVTGMALGLANWNYNGQSLKSLKDNK